MTKEAPTNECTCACHPPIDFDLELFNRYWEQITPKDGTIVPPPTEDETSQIPNSIMTVVLAKMSTTLSLAINILKETGKLNAGLIAGGTFAGIGNDLLFGKEPLDQAFISSGLGGLAGGAAASAIQTALHPGSGPPPIKVVLLAGATGMVIGDGII